MINFVIIWGKHTNIRYYKHICHKINFIKKKKTNVGNFLIYTYLILKNGKIFFFITTLSNCVKFRVKEWSIDHFMVR